MGLFSSEPIFLSDGESYIKMRELITEAEESLAIVSPYMDPTDDFVRAIETAALEGVAVQVLCRKDVASEYRRAAWFKRLGDAGVSFGCVDRLHSKVYLSDQHALVTSMNFHRSSGENSFEAGIFVEWDNKLYKSVEDYVKSLERHVERIGDAGVRRPWPSRKTSTSRSGRRSTGHCIRCRERISFSATRPYCESDYQQWARFKNHDFVDRYCHGCGEPWDATMKRPLCKKCFERSRAA